MDFLGMDFRGTCSLGCDGFLGEPHCDVFVNENKCIDCESCPVARIMVMRLLLSFRLIIARV